MLIASARPNNGPMIPPLEAGTYAARCIQIYDLGIHFDQTYGKEKHRICIVFEIPSEKVTIEGKEQTRQMWKEYTLSLGDRAELRRDLEAWRGKQFTEDELKAFDLKNVLNSVCVLNVIERTSKGGNKYSTIGGIAKAMKGVTCPPATQEIFAFDLDKPEDLEVIESFSNKWIREKIKSSLTYEKLSGQKVEEEVKNTNFTDVNTDDLPF